MDNSDKIRLLFAHISTGGNAPSFGASFVWIAGTDASWIFSCGKMSRE